MKKMNVPSYPFCCVLAIDDSPDSKEAENLLDNLNLNGYFKQRIESEPGYEAPFLIIPSYGTYRNLKDIKRFSEDKDLIDKLRNIRKFGTSTKKTLLGWIFSPRLLAYLKIFNGNI